MIQILCRKSAVSTEFGGDVLYGHECSEVTQLRMRNKNRFGSEESRRIDGKEQGFVVSQRRDSFMESREFFSKTWIEYHRQMFVSFHLLS
jgi:hypothetical protein